MKTEYRKVVKVGYSLMVAIPPKYAKELGLEAGDFLAIQVEGGKLVMRRAEVKAC